ncbi:hypothetical protein Trco_001516 [Trichoderma cornu-damae]|uniref:F-box domain-containing protein n=1 Tax=Trichoderma cornu-damae TaxID=654480 RepID=A0A9P8TXD7_9HYPO|nr:hypothetical protein Trco_001516 [Trichoderma cornu-damae]
MVSSGILHKRIDKKRGKKSVARKNAASALLKMPVELIRDISDNLSTVDKVIFATTCRPMRNTLGLTNIPDAAPELEKDKFEYLARMCRDKPGKWVCEECMRCHSIDASDTPASPHLVCPVGVLDHGRFNQSLRLIVRQEYRLGRRHVQLALKYTRLGSNLSRSHRHYLSRLMAPRQYSYSHLWGNAPVNNGIKIAPRVVDGRFLLKSIFEYRRAARPMPREILDHDFVCQHQSVFPEHDQDWTSDPLLQNSLSLHRTVGEAFETPGQEVQSHCPFCFTDFSVKASAKSIRISVWQDLGTESSPLDPVWLTFVHNPILNPHAQDVTNEEPGRVRELYEGEHEDD